MSLVKPIETQKDRVRSTVDLVLLKSLLNKTVNAQQQIFNVKIEFTTNKTWQVFVEGFKHTYIPVDPSQLAKQQEMQALAEKLAVKLLDAMSVKNVPEFGKPKAEKTGEKK